MILSAVFTFLFNKLIANFIVRSQMKKCSKIMKMMVKIRCKKKKKKRDEYEIFLIDAY